MPAIEAVLFDWGGTLTPYHDIDVLATWAHAARAMAPDRAEEISEALWAAEREYWLRTESTSASFTTRELFDRVCVASGLDLDDALRAAAESAYREAWRPHIPARAGAVDVLRALRDRGLRTGLLSNTHWPREWHEDGLAEDGLLDLLDVRMYTSELTHMKPHPSVFQTLLDVVGTTADRAVFVGDRLYDDVSGAKALGMRAVWIPNSFVPTYDVEPDAVIDDLSELVAVIDGFVDGQAG
jgi:putative hydrolase of the HAD superfamily